MTGAPPGGGRAPPPGLRALAFAAIALSFVAVPGWGAGPALAIVLLAIALVLRRRGYQVRRALIAAALALVISAISAGSCVWFFLRPAEVSGRDEIRHGRADARFDDAFDRTAAPPPPRRHRADGGAATLDGGTAFGDDAGSR